MKRRFTTVLLVLLLFMSFSFSVSARDVEIFEKEGVTYCWVRGTGDPDKYIPGNTWVPVKEGRDQKTRLGVCDDASKANHVCDGFCDYARIEYLWKSVVREVLMVDCRNQAGDAMVGSSFILLKENVVVDDVNKTVQYLASDSAGGGEVERDGIARIRLNESVLDPTAEFQQLVLGQIIPEDQLETYRPSPNRWYVNLVVNARGEYEIYSLTEAPAYNITDYEEFKKDKNYNTKEGENVSNYYASDQTLFVKNDYRVGDLDVEIKVEGFDLEVPANARTIVTISGPGPVGASDNYSKKLRKSGELSDMRMGEYKITYSNPVSVEGYTEVEPVVTVKVRCPVDSEPVELTGDVKTVTLNRDQANAVVYVTYTYTPDHVHDFEAVETDPTCTEEGYITYTCKDESCGYRYKDDKVEPFGHNYKPEVVESTCTEVGYTKYTCTECGDTYSDVGQALGHVFDGEGVKTSPTCTEKGYTTHTCDRCGTSYTDSEVDPTGHRYEKTGEVDPTCTQDGKIQFVCLNCGDEKADPGEAALGHDIQFSKFVDATCTVGGYNLHICTRCEREYKEEVEPASGHKYSETVTKPTCTEKGYTTYTCTVENCGYSYKGVEVGALGHSYVNQVIEPTTEREGYTLHTCSVCKDTYTDEIKEKLSNDDDSRDDDDDDSGNSGADGNSSGTAANSSTVATPTATPAPAATTSMANASIFVTDTVIAKAIDELNDPLKSTVVALFNGKTQLHQWNCAYDNVSILDNLDKYVKEGESMMCTLAQTKAPAGYEVSEDRFTVKISKKNGKTEVAIKGNASASESIESGRDGKPIITFRNQKKTTQIELSCQVAFEFDKDCRTDEALVAEYQNKKYEFLLKWKDIAGEEQTESIMLSHGEIGLLQAKLPFGTEYEITGTDPDGSPVTGFSENASGTLTAKQVEENVRVEAALNYRVQTGAPLELSMMVRNSESGEPVEGATFELKDSDGAKVGTYISRSDGELDITGVFTAPGDYLLTQTRTPEGYEMISGGAPVMVSLVYAPSTGGGSQVLEQTLVATVAHQDVSQEGDGSFGIEVMSSGAVLQQESKNGNFGRAMGVVGGVAAVSGVAAASVAGTILIRKRRRKGLQ